MSGPGFGTWTCHVCGDERPDDKISVRQHITNAAGGFQVTQNVRYCNDRTDCIVGSIDYRHRPDPPDVKYIVAAPGTMATWPPVDSRAGSPTDPQPVDNPVDSHPDHRAETAGTVPDAESGHGPRET